MPHFSPDPEMTLQWDVAFDPDGGPAVVTLIGKLAIEAHQRMVEDILGHPEWNAGLPILFDHRQVDFSGVHYEELLAMFATHAANEGRIGPARSAILTNPGADYGIMRQFELIAGDAVTADFQVFTDEAAARRWLRQ